jgi:hypothetical protein
MVARAAHHANASGMQPQTSSTVDDSTAVAMKTAKSPAIEVSVSFLHKLLQVVNYTQLNSAPFLDPLLASKRYHDIKDVVWQQQMLFCRWVGLPV